MGVIKFEKLSEEFSDHERPHLTTDTHIKINDKRKVALLLGEFLSPRLFFVSQYFQEFEPKEVGMKMGSRPLSLAPALNPTQRRFLQARLLYSSYHCPACNPLISLPQLAVVTP